MSEHGPEIAWFLAQCKPNSYRIAKKNLTRQGFRTFLPLQEETTRVRSKFVTKLHPLFPGYLFVAFDKEQGGFRAVNSTYGVTRLVSFGRDPAPVPTDLVDLLMQRCDRSEKLIPPTPFKPGDQVLLTKGPFTDFFARIDSVASDRRIWVLMEIMGGPTRVAVGAEQLQVVANGLP